MTLHIKTLVINQGDDTLYVDLQFAPNTPFGYGVQARITRQKRRGAEKLVGIAAVNKAGEICRFGDADLSDVDIAAIEKEILGAVGE